MKTSKLSIIGISALLALGGCAATPMGPTVQVMPDPNKPFPVFQQDQTQCENYAQSQVAGQADAANQQAVGVGVLTTVVGAAIGGAIGGGQGAGAGAALGAGVGVANAAGTQPNAQMTIQQRYDNAYSQCMYSRGNQVPGMYR
ncbi:MAG: glycine zipper family protein [Acidocella sp.]|nr:glycine zipper family protein [Acidocella sp.]